MPVFAKDHTVQHDFLWWDHDGNRAIRIGDWKLVDDHTKPWELFDLSKDRSETKNLASVYPEKVKEMEQAWLKHARELHDLATQDMPPDGPGKQNRGKQAASRPEVD